MGDEIDPEVQADLQLRAETIRERGRPRVPKEPSYSPPVFVGEWPCKVCKRPVAITAEAAERLEVFNRILAARDEQPLDQNRIMFCDSCANMYRETAPQRRRAQVDRMIPVIHKLKGSANPEQEFALIKQLQDWHHPDIAGLIQTIRNRLDAKQAKGKPTGAM